MQYYNSDAPPMVYLFRCAICTAESMRSDDAARWGFSVTPYHVHHDTYCPGETVLVNLDTSREGAQ